MRGINSQLADKKKSNKKCIKLELVLICESI